MRGKKAGGTQNEISGGVVIGPAVLGQNIALTLGPQVKPVLALSGLPPASPVFVGRQGVTQELIKELEQGAAECGQRAVGLTAVGGLAGVGKTELVIQVAHDALRRGWFPGGVLYADMFGYDDDRRRDPGDVLLGMLMALGVPGEHVPAHCGDRSRMFVSVLAEFSAQGQRILVVADNVSSADQVRPLLPADGATAAIVTSRHTLAMLDARLLDLDVLDLDGAVAMLAQRAAMNLRDDPRVSADPEGVAALAEVCGRLPLALKVAAARLVGDPAQTPAELAHELREVRPLDGLAYEHNEVRRAFELSYRALSSDQQRLFRLLPLNPGPQISTEAAARLTGWDAVSVRQALKKLARAHLIEQGPRDWWRLHDLVREYADSLGVEHDTTDDRNQALERLLRYYEVTTIAAVAHLDPQALDPIERGFADRDEALAWLDAQFPNLIAAIRLASTMPANHAMVWLFEQEIATFLLWRRHFNDWIDLANIALASAERLGDPYCQAATLVNLGIASHELRRFEEAINAYQVALAIFRTIGYREGELSALRSLGGVLSDVGRFEEAVAALQHTASVYRESDERYKLGPTLCNLGEALWEAKRIGEAIDVLHEAAALCRETGNRNSEGNTYNHLGVALQEAGRFPEAITAHTKAVSLFRETDNLYGKAGALNNRGIALRKVQRFGEAVTAHTDAASLLRETGDRHGEAGARNNLGLTLQEAGRYGEAITAHTDAASLYHETDDLRRQAGALNDLANALTEMRCFEQALSVRQKCVDICRKIGDLHSEGRGLGLRAATLAEAGRWEEAISACQASVSLFEEMGDERWRDRSLEVLALLEERYDKARRHHPRPE